MANRKSRVVKEPNRYGSTVNENMDSMFDAVRKSSSNDDSFEIIELPGKSRQLSDASNSTSSSVPEKNPSKENGSQNALQRQMARLEVKLNEMFAIVMQIHRASVSNAVSAQMEIENVPELPLESDESLNKFELDLAQRPYRERIVSRINRMLLSTPLCHLNRICHEVNMQHVMLHVIQRF